MVRSRSGSTPPSSEVSGPRRILKTRLRNVAVLASPRRGNTIPENGHVITCPACGTDNREWASHCGECGKPLPTEARPPRPVVDAPRADRLPTWLRQDIEESGRKEKLLPDAGRRGNAMPPLPDGGLAGSMPPWLSAPDRDARPEPPPRTARPERVDSDDAPDITTFLSPEDLPAWLRQLAQPPPPAGQAVTAHATDTPRRLPGASIGDDAEMPMIQPIRSRASPDTQRAPTVIPRPPTVIPSAGEESSRQRPDERKGRPDGQLTAFILGGLALALLMIAYAVYLGMSG